MNPRKLLFHQVNNLIETKLIPRQSKSHIDINKVALKSPYALEENLFSSKSNKEILLSQIKTVQMSLLFSNKSIPQKEKFNNVKKLLEDLKQNLVSMLAQKKEQKLYLKKSINDTKQILQDKLFNKNTNESKEKEENIIKETDVLEKNYGGDELSKLKMLNFKAENEIDKLNFMIENKTYMLNFLKITNIYPEEKIEIFYDYQKQNSNEIDDSFNFYINQDKEKLNQIIILKKEQNKEIFQLENDINYIKKNIEYEKNMNLILNNLKENNNMNNLSKLYNSFIKNNMNNINNQIFFNGKKRNSQNVYMNFNIKINKYISTMINKSLAKSTRNNSISYRIDKFDDNNYNLKENKNKIILKNKNKLLQKIPSTNKIIIH